MKLERCIVIVVVLMFCRTSCGVTTESPASIQQQHEAYLERYGYMGRALSNANSTSTLLDDASDPATTADILFTNAVKLFQSMNGLPVTGVVDDDMLAKMATPRCGVPDFPPASGTGSRRRRKRFVTSGLKWSSGSATYQILNYTPKLTQGDINTTISQAVKMWTDVSSVSLTKSTTSTADTLVGFYSLDHGDGSSFDGPGGVLAHGFYPGFGWGGDLHFDADEAWTVNTIFGTNLLYVATHELGHTLGMAHSLNHNAIMAPYYRGYNPNLQLTQDDINGIQNIYGPPKAVSTTTTTPRTTATTTTTPATAPTTTTTTTTPVTTTTTTTTTTTPVTTPSTTTTTTPKTTPTTATTTAPATTPTTTTRTTTPVITTTTTSRTTTTSPTTTPSTRPRTISTTTPITTTTTTTWNWCDDGAFDAVVNINGTTYAFRGSMYARLTSTGIDTGYPRPIANDWPVLPSDLGAAFYWNSSATDPIPSTYFIKGGTCWRYNIARQLMPGYPQLIRNEFPGVPTDPTTAFVINDVTYFTKGSQYYKYTRQVNAVGTSQVNAVSSIWSVIPYPVTAVMQWTNSRIYVFCGQSYYRINDQLLTPDYGFPRPISVLWLGCSDQSEVPK